MIRSTMLKGPLGVSLAAIAVVVFVIIAQAPPVLKALFSSGASEEQTLSSLRDHLAKHEEVVKTHVDRFNGRSIFYRPQAWPLPPPPPELIQVRTPDPEPREHTKPIPLSYEGPAVIALLGSEVMFVGGDRVRLGQTGRNGVKVVEIRPPFTVKLGYSGGEYDVRLFTNIPVGTPWVQTASNPIPGTSPTRFIVPREQSEQPPAVNDDDDEEADDETEEAESENGEDDDEEEEEEEQPEDDPEDPDEPQEPAAEPSAQPEA